MKNRMKQHSITLTSAGFLLVLALFYFTQPEFAISFNRMLEMLNSGSGKSLAMIFYQQGAFAPLFIGLGHWVQLTVPFFKSGPLFQASLLLYSPVVTLGLMALSGCFGMWFFARLGRGLSDTAGFRLSAKPHPALQGLFLFLPLWDGGIQSVSWLILGLLGLEAGWLAFGLTALGFVFKFVGQ